MRTVSILNLLLLVTVIGLILALWQSRIQLDSRDAEIAKIETVADRLRDELGRIDVVDPNRYQIRKFYQRHRRSSYAVDQHPEVDFRFRVYAPDASNFELQFKSGTLPKQGFPETGSSIFHILKRPTAGPAEVTIVARADVIDKDSGSLNIDVSVQTADSDESSRSLHTGINDNGMPWNFIGLSKCKSEKLKYKSDEPFDLDAPVLLMKKYTVNKEGEHQGFMMWIEPHSKPMPSSN